MHQRYRRHSRWHRQIVELWLRRGPRCGSGAPRLTYAGDAGHVGPDPEGAGAGGSTLGGGEEVGAAFATARPSASMSISSTCAPGEAAGVGRRVARVAGWRLGARNSWLTAGKNNVLTVLSKLYR